MKPAELSLAADALDAAKGILEQLPPSAEVRDLHRRWYALRTVIHGVVVERVPTVSAAQESKLMESAVVFAGEVAEAQRRLGR